MAILPNNISSLSEAEKYDLLDALWEDIEAHASGLSAEQTEEIDRRVPAYEKEPSDVTSWEQVRAGLPKR
jgi:putative addiction module component (TIGR02574 family)